MEFSDRTKCLIDKDKAVNIVYETIDYDKFVIIEGNRDIDHAERIKRSMKERYVPAPICVNEKFEVIDGQNRLAALKALHKPIQYVVINGLGIKDVRAMNQGSKNWQKKDFIKSYAHDGKEEYLKFVQFLKKYPDFQASTAEYILRLSGRNDSDFKSHGQSYNSVKRGIFTIKDYERSCEVADMIMKYKGLDGNRAPIYRRKEFVLAIIKLSRLKDFDNDEVIRKIKLYPRIFVPCITTADYVSMLEEIYNYRKRIKVRFNV